MDLAELKQQAKNLDPVLRIGKNGLTENVFMEIEKLLKKRKLIKIKFLNNSPIEDFDDAISLILRKSGAVLVLKVGNVITIYRERR